MARLIRSAALLKKALLSPQVSIHISPPSEFKAFVLVFHGCFVVSLLITVNQFNLFNTSDYKHYIYYVV